MTKHVVLGVIFGILSACAAGRVVPSSEFPIETHVRLPPDAGEDKIVTALTATTTQPPPPILLRRRGVNLSGGEFGSRVPGTYGVDYKYPSREDVDYFATRGMNHLRVLFRHERLQRQLQGPLDEAEWGRLLDLVTYASVDRSMSVTIVPYNSARFYDHVLTEVQMGDLWGRIAVRLKTHPAAARLYLNLTNEPHDMTTESWVALANAGIREIRRVGFVGLVQAPGNGWSGGQSWSSSWFGTPNSIAMLNVVDPQDNLAFEIHQYLDTNASGASDCVNKSIGSERIAGFIDWLRKNGKHGWLGEFAAPNTPTCRVAVTRMLDLVERSYDVFMGWSWYGAGVWSFATTYPLSIGPTPPGVPEKPQMAWLKPFLPGCP